MKKHIGTLIVIALVAGAFVANDAMAADAEDQIVGIIERVLNVIADFFDRIFQSIADAVKSIFSGDDAGKK